MEIKKLSLVKPWDAVEVIIERKKVKKVRLRVLPNCVIKLSVPLGVSDEWIDCYLISKKKWVEKSLDDFKRTEATELEPRINSGVSTWILGRQIRIIVKQAKIYKIEQTEETVCIQSPAIEDKRSLQKQFESWCQKQCKLYFQSTVDRLYPIIAKHGIDKPTLQVRKMKTLWGSCSNVHSKISLNYYLYKAPPFCIDYVVLHELIHFLFPKHNQDFYEFLTVHMPDWQERKRILDYEIVKGLQY